MNRKRKECPTLNVEEGNLQLFAQMDRMRRAWQNVVPWPGLSKSDFATLMTIAHGGKPCCQSSSWHMREDGVTLTALATVMKRSLPAISQRVRALEESGYVRRLSETGDRRVSSVCLTPEGDALLHQAYRQFVNVMNKALSGMTQTEIQTLMQLLAKLASSLENLEQPT